MKINWDRLIKRDRGSLLFLGYGCFLIAIILLYLDFTKPVIKSKDDLLFISGPITDLNFYDGNRGTHIYTIKLKNYTNTFQIKADFLSFFKSEAFRTIPPKQEVTIAIPKKFQKTLNTKYDILFIYSLTSNTETYLDYVQALKQHNSNLLKYFSVLAAVIGIVNIHFGNKAKNKTPIFD